LTFSCENKTSQKFSPNIFMGQLGVQNTFSELFRPQFFTIFLNKFNTFRNSSISPPPPPPPSGEIGPPSLTFLWEGVLHPPVVQSSFLYNYISLFCIIPLISEYKHNMQYIMYTSSGLNHRVQSFGKY
jgi:hypothetical protein